MAVKTRPGFKTNVDRTTKATAKRTVFFDIKPDTTVTVRFTPTSNESGELFFESSQHFKFEEDGEGRAWACLNVHGDGKEECPICDALARAEEVLGKAAAKGLLKDHSASNRWHVQVVPVYTAAGVEPADQTYILGLSMTTAEKVSTILKMDADNRLPLLTDPEAGQTLQIKRTGSGFKTKYEVLPTGVRVPLDKILPDWEKKFLDMEKALKLRVEDRKTLLASMKETFGNAVFSELFPKG